MKKLIFILLFLPFFIYGQDDKIILNNGDTIYGNLVEVGVNSITYQYKNEATNNIIKKRDVAKVIYSSGRTQEFKGLKKLEFELKKQKNRIKKQKRHSRPIFGYGKKGSYWASAGVFFIKNAVEKGDMPNPNFITPSFGLKYIHSLNKKLNFDISTNYNQNKIIKYIELTTVDLPDGGIGKISLCEYKLNFININPNIEINIFKNFNFLVGPFFSFIINKNANYTEEYKNQFMLNSIDWVAYDENLNERIKKQINNIDYGIEVGLSFYLTDQIKLISMYKLGLYNLWDPDDDRFFYPSPPQLDDYVTEGINLSVVYRIKTLD